MTSAVPPSGGHEPPQPPPQLDPQLDPQLECDEPQLECEEPHEEWWWVEPESVTLQE